jgi:hypothetical protein
MVMPRVAPFDGQDSNNLIFPPQISLTVLATGPRFLLEKGKRKGPPISAGL